MDFRRFDPVYLPELMTWFPDRQSCLTWGGAEFRFPFTAESFREDSKIDSIATWSLVGNGSLAGFGQCYLRIGRCHFGRLAISPARRGQGLGTQLIRELAAWGLAEFGDSELSLFVNKENDRAFQLYRLLGFRSMPYPEPSSFMANSHYMVAARLTETASY